MSKNVCMSENIFNAWKKIVLDPPMGFIELLAAETEKTAGIRPSGRDVKSFIRTKIALRSEHEESPPRSRQTPNRVYVHTNLDGEYAGTRPKWFSLGGEQRNVRTWREMVVKVCEIAAAQKKDDFKGVLFRICAHGSRLYFSRSKDALRKGKNVPGTDIYVTTNLSANNAKSLCDRISEIFGYGREIRVELWG